MVPGGYIPPVLGVWSTPGTAICTVNGRRDSAMATSAHPPAATRSWLTNWVYPSPQRHHASLGMCRQPIWGGHNGKRWAGSTWPEHRFGAPSAKVPDGDFSLIWIASGLPTTRNQRNVGRPLGRVLG